MTVQIEPSTAPRPPEELSRRELLNYAWLASLGILALQSGAILYRFAMPRSAPGAFGGPVNIGAIESLPGPGAAPLPFDEAKFWWVTTDQGALALYKVCTHLGCIYDWRDADGIFGCPCHGSEFGREGAFIAGPAPRGLDRFVIRAIDGAGEEVARTNASGDPLPIPPGSTVIVETRQRIVGPARV